MRILIDAMSGDNAPLEIIKGAALANREYPVDIILVGQEEIIRQIAEENEIDLGNIEIVKPLEPLLLPLMTRHMEGIAIQRIQHFGDLILIHDYLRGA